tara:strand:+ start:2971 stop:3279 length:309 start_codon:yes stop_codon:yes gene_type:complete
MINQNKIQSAVLLGVGLLILGCGGSSDKDLAGGLSGFVKVDGSSTVFPITEAMAEEFGKVHPKVRVTVGVSRYLERAADHTTNIAEDIIYMVEGKISRHTNA